jgi:SAM-dependent methyltransferase
MQKTVPDAAPPPEFWHRRYLQQAKWTSVLRERAIQLASLATGARVLEVGSGTGVITKDLRKRTSAIVFGVDIDLDVTRYACAQDSTTRYSLADGLNLPFPAETFDATLAHFLLLWVKDPGALAREMARVTRTGGWVLCLAEPDYGGRIDHPPAFVELGRLQTESLRRQGADPFIGRKIRSLLIDAGLGDVRSGVLGAEWTGAPSPEELDSEWSVLSADLCEQVPAERLSRLREEEFAAWSKGDRVLYVPTFFAFGRRQ